MSFATPWGPIGYITFARTYARRVEESNPDSRTETFDETTDRVIKASKNQLKINWSTEQENTLKYYLMSLKFSVAGRFLWQLGTKTVDKRGLFSLQNCAFVVVDHPIDPFCWAFDALMLGSGVGYNIQKEFVYELPKPKTAKITRVDSNDADFIVPDSREGWVELLRKTLESHYYTGKGFTYSTVCVRGKGALIKGFGGVASGPEELCWGIQEISKILNGRAGKKVRPIDCLDIMNIIGSVVVSGNVRRSAQIAIGDCDDRQFLNAKRWDLGNVPNWRAMSNNSVVCNDMSILPEEFWQGYNGNGEPYGLINLKLSQSCGRIGETQYPDKDVLGYNPCFAGEINVLTEDGYQRLDSLVGRSVNVWNGFEWSEVTPRITGHNRKMLTVTLSDGRSLRCTDNHKWVIVNGYGAMQTEERIEAKDLVPGQKLLKHQYPVLSSGIRYLDAYTQGFISADGQDNKSSLYLYEPKYMCESRLNGTSNGKVYSHEHQNSTRKILKLNFQPMAKEWVPFDGDLQSRLEWFAGLLDGDGTELKEGGAQICSINREFLLGVQKMLTTMGVHSKVVHARNAESRMMPDGHGGQKHYDCQELWRVCIGATQIQHLKCLGMTCNRLVFDKSPNRDASQFVQIVDVKESGTEDVVYCFTEPKRHLGCFEGIVTGQCGEQSLASYETCCLSEVFLPNIESKEQFFDVLSYAYKICKHSMMLPCHQEKTQEIVHKNMRMGIGVTGQLQATDEQRSWLSEGYQYLRELDNAYSSENNLNKSIKLTTCKPSGTLSLLAGVTPGCHPGFSQYFIRRIRIASNSSLVQTCKEHGYPIEHQKNFDGTVDKNTVVVSFPCAFPEGTKLAKDMTAVDQLENVKWLQTNWSDNAVSCTVYYRAHELPEIQNWLSQNYNTSIKSCSFLLHSDHGFIQAPYEEITKEEYLQLSSQVKQITGGSMMDLGLDDSDCASGACPVK